MVIVREKLASCAARAAGRLSLAFERRQRSRQRAMLDSGEEIGMVMPRGEEELEVQGCAGSLCGSEVWTRAK